MEVPVDVGQFHNLTTEEEYANDLELSIGTYLFSCALQSLYTGSTASPPLLWLDDFFTKYRALFYFIPFLRNILGFANQISIVCTVSV
jgi:hypothetical protein